MINYKSIKRFRDSLINLLSIKKHVYSAIKTEITNEFNTKTIEEIRNNRDMILMQDDSIIIKLRLPDKKQKLSKRDGYRLIYYVSKVEELVIFLNVYPKNGPLQKLNITPLELKDILLELIEELSSDKLEEFDINITNKT